MHSRQFRVDYPVNLYAPSKRGKSPAGAEAAKEIFKISGKIVRTFNTTRPKMCTDTKYTTVVAAAVFGLKKTGGDETPTRHMPILIGKGEKMAQETKVVDQALQAMTDKEGKYLTFNLAGEEYGIGILKVKEIIGIMPITVVPQTPSYIKGVINLRGKVIPVIDLRLKFSLAAAEFTERTCIIVVEIAAEERTIMMGIVVDSVSEVLNIKGADIEATLSFGTRLNTEYILGMAKTGEGIKILLDIDKILSAEELQAASGIV